MRILFLVGRLSAGGAERVAATLASAWAEAGHQVTLAPTFVPKGECFYPLSPKVDLHWLADGLKPGGQPMLTLRKLSALRALMAERKPDVVVSFLTNVNVMALLATLGLRVPLIVCERTDPVHGRSAGRVLKALRRVLYPRAAAVVVQTQAAIEGMKTQAPGVRRIVSIANPLPETLEALDSPAARRAAERSGVRQLAAMGRLIPTKQFDVLIRAFAGLAQRLPEWRLNIWGEGPMRERLQAQIDEAGLGGRIHLAGRTSEPWQALAQADAFAMTSAVEGFPNVLLEAMALGLPCVTMDCPSGPADMTRRGEDALLVPLGDEAALAQALVRLMEDSQLRAALGAQAAQSVRARYGLPAVLAQWDALMRDVMKAKARAESGSPAKNEAAISNSNMSRTSSEHGDKQASANAVHGPGQAVSAPSSLVSSAAPLRVVHIISGLGQGGAETVLYRLVTAPGQDTRHHVVSLTDDGVFGERLRAAGVTVTTLGMPSGRLSLSGLRRLYRLLKDERPDAVQTWMYHADLIGGVVARLAGIRAVSWGIRNSGANLAQGSRASRISAWLCARLSRWVPARIVACAEEASRRHRAWGYRADIMRVIPNGYDLSRWQPDAQARARLREQWGVADDAVLIGSVARWNPLKDHANFLAAFAQCVRQRPELKAVLAGDGISADNAELMALVDKHGLRDQVLLLGRRDDVPAVMNALDVHVLSSLAEGFPNVVAEAMATGVACVATDVGDAALIVGQDGWVAPPRNAQALADAVLKAVQALGSPATQQQLRRVRERIASEYGLARMVRAYDEVWRGMASKNTGQPMADAVAKRLLIVINNPAFFMSHRLPLALGAREAGFDVHVATMDGPAVAQIVEQGLTHHVIPLSRSGGNPLQELNSIRALWRLFRRLKPELVHAVTIKPVLYAGIAARLARVPAYVAAISGLGFLFLDNSRKGIWVRRVVTALYRMALGHRNSRVIFQNRNDADVLRRAGAVRAEQIALIRGSGVDLGMFQAVPAPDGPPVALMVARMLKDKGVREFVEAARLAAGQPKGLRWVLAGSPDPGNPASVTEQELLGWQDEGVVTWLGEQHDINGLYRDSHIAVLPSYREGLPKSLIEAAACGRAVVTTDVPGCRDAIEPGLTGLLVPARDAKALCEAVQRLAGDTELRVSMGQAGRKLAEEAFDIREVVRRHVEIYQALTRS